MVLEDIELDLEWDEEKRTYSCTVCGHEYDPDDVPMYIVNERDWWRVPAILYCPCHAHETDCPRCGGTGVLEASDRWRPREVPCHSCRGTGRWRYEP